MTTWTLLATMAWRENFDFLALLKAYGQTIGWAIAAGIGMGLGLIITLKIFTFLTREVDEWALVKAGNIPIGIILGAVVIGTSIVIAMVAKA
jgi:uncharacterized membrane protein YjfL (UPF0719 family)